MLCKFCASLAFCGCVCVCDRAHLSDWIVSSPPPHIQFSYSSSSFLFFFRHIEIDSTFEWFRFHCFFFHVESWQTLPIVCCLSGAHINISSQATLKIKFLLFFLFVYIFDFRIESERASEVKQNNINRLTWQKFQCKVAQLYLLMCWFDNNPKETSQQTSEQASTTAQKQINVMECRLVR